MSRSVARATIKFKFDCAERSLHKKPMRNPYQLGRLSISLTRMVLDVGQLERVLEISDALMKLCSPADTRVLLNDFRRSPAGDEALRTKHRLVVDPQALSDMPAETLGGAYGRFMLERGLKPESLARWNVRSDAEYVLAHLYETHDMWHVVTGFDTDLLGEIALQAFYLAQHRSYLPLFALSAVFLNTALFSYEDKGRRLDAMVQGWQLGKRASPLVGIDWNRELGRFLDDIRRDLRLQRDNSGQPEGEVS